MTVNSYGATLLSAKTRVSELPNIRENQDEENQSEVKYEELTLCRDTLADLKNRDTNPYYGATCGRVAGRIAGAKFEVSGKTYELAANNGNSCLHGGNKGYDTHIWESTVLD